MAFGDAPGVTHRLSATVADRGYAASHGAAVCSEGATEYVSAADQPCVTRLTVTYDGDDPGGVVAWVVCNDRDPFYNVCPGEYPDAGWDATDPCGRCPDNPPQNPPLLSPPRIDGAADGSTPLVVVSESTSEIVVDCLVRWPSSLDGQTAFADRFLDGFVRVAATTARGDHEQLNFKVDCERLYPLEALGLVGEGAPACPTRRAQVVAVDDAGPNYSAAGKRVTVLVRDCEGAGPTPAFGDACCDDTHTDGPATYTAQEIEAVEGSLARWAATMRPPRIGEPWSASPPAVRLRWPIVAAGAVEPDAAYSQYHAGAVAVYEVFLGNVDQGLLLTPSRDWGPGTPNGVVVAHAPNGLFRIDDFTGATGEFYEVDCTLATAPAAPPAAQTTARLVAEVRATNGACNDCCGCRPVPVGGPVFPTLHYVRTATYGEFICTWEEVINFFTGETATRTKTYEYVRLDRDESRETFAGACGAVIGYGPRVFSGAAVGDVLEFRSLFFDDPNNEGCTDFIGGNGHARQVNVSGSYGSLCDGPALDFQLPELTCDEITFASLQFEVPCSEISIYEGFGLTAEGPSPGPDGPRLSADGMATVTVCVPDHWLNSPPASLHMLTGATTYDDGEGSVTTTPRQGAEGDAIQIPAITTCPRCVSSTVATGVVRTWNAHACGDLTTNWLT